MSEDRLSVVAVAGSLRRNSYNAAALRAADQLAPSHMRIEIFDIGSVPLYNEDIRTTHLPPSVAEFRSQLKDADGVLIATPEYNYSVPGVLKNAIDWASRPPDQPFDQKPVAIIGASPSPMGSSRAQYHLRQILVCLNAFVMPKPELIIANASQRFDIQGQLTDETTREALRKCLDAFAGFILRVRA
jgi:chromate reductase, NAD(P)H dehydrogenase (quinone)